MSREKAGAARDVERAMREKTGDNTFEYLELVFPARTIPFAVQAHAEPRVVVLVGPALAHHTELLDVHSDPDHNRSVFTLVGDEEDLVAALLSGIATAQERIDLRRHEGAHPRIGAADVVPIVALDPAAAERARACALRLADRIGSELELPVFLYADSAPGHGPAFFRQGGPVELQRRIDAGEVRPDFGPARLDERAG